MLKEFTKIIIGICALSFVSCASVPGDTVLDVNCVSNSLDSLEISDGCRSKLPVNVAILPFENETAESEADYLVRQAFYSHFSSKRYRDIELYEVDDILAENGLIEDNGYIDAAPEYLGEILAADGLLYGKITGYNKVFLGLYSNVYVELEVKMVDPGTGKILWIAKHRTIHHEGEIPLELIGIISAMFRNSMHISDKELLRTVDDLCRTVVAALPEPEPVNVVAGKVMSKYNAVEPLTFCP